MHAEKLQQYWNEQTILLQRIINAGGFEKYIVSEPNQAEIWRLPNRSLGCIDEGCAKTGYHLAGSGILLGVDKTVGLVKKAGIDEVTSHDGCGAAGLYAKREGLDTAKSDNYGIVFSQKVAEIAGLKYRHITAEEMARPAEFHIARLAVYGGTGRFNPTAIQDFPAAFWISRHLNPDANEELIISVQIALGNHGFGSLITQQEPFHVLVVGKKDAPLLSAQTLNDELTPLLKEYNSRIVIHLFNS